MRILYILWLRQIKRYLRSPARLVGSFGQPLLFLVALGFGFGPIYAKAGDGNYIQFLAPGVICMGILFTAIFSGIEVIWDKQFGYLKETLVAPVSRWQIMLGRTLGGATVAMIQGLIIFILSTLVGFRPNMTLFVPALIIMFIIALLYTALGTAIASKLDDMQGFQLIMNFLVMPTFFLSGALFPITGLPKIVSVLVHANPLSYGVDGLRITLTGAPGYGIGTDLIIISATTLIALLVGTYFFSKIEA